MDGDERAELAAMLDSALEHLRRYILGSAKDSQGEFDAATLLIGRVHERLLRPED